MEVKCRTCKKIFNDPNADYPYGYCSDKCNKMKRVSKSILSDVLTQELKD